MDAAARHCCKCL